MKNGHRAAVASRQSALEDSGTTTPPVFDSDLDVEDTVAIAPDDLCLERPSAIMRLTILATIVIPVLGLAAATMLTWSASPGWTPFIVFAAGYAITAMGVTIGYHRLFTHKSFETNRAVQAIVAICGSMAVEGPLLRWVAMHRCHHQHSDREDDPHSPNTHGTGFRAMVRGLVHAHMGWLFLSDPPDLKRYVPDLEADAMLRRISKLFPLWVVLSLLIPAAIGFAVSGTWLGALMGFLWGGLVRVFFVHHVTWSINSVCHIWGARPYRSNDHSRNNAIFGILGFGEGWHNNHHAFPTSARHGLEWWQFDMSWLVIRSLAVVGLARDVKVPSADRRAAKSAPGAD